MPDLAKLPAGPLRLSNTATRGHPAGRDQPLYVLDADGRKIAALWGTPDEKIAMGEVLLHAVRGGANG